MNNLTLDDVKNMRKLIYIMGSYNELEMRYAAENNIDAEPLVAYIITDDDFYVIGYAVIVLTKERCIDVFNTSSDCLASIVDALREIDAEKAKLLEEQAEESSSGAPLVFITVDVAPADFMSLVQQRLDVVNKRFDIPWQGYSVDVSVRSERAHYRVLLNEKVVLSTSSLSEAVTYINRVIKRAASVELN